MRSVNEQVYGNRKLFRQFNLLNVPVQIKADAGLVFHVHCQNNNAAVRYLKLYDKATTPTVGTDVPVKTYTLKASDQFIIDLFDGIPFTTKIWVAGVTGFLDSDNTAPTANDLIAYVEYI